MLERNDIIQNRYDKVEELRKGGMNPYVNRFLPTHKSTDILEKPEEYVDTEKKVIVAGRILTIRTFGKAAFFHIQDVMGKIQVFIKKGILPEEDFSLFKTSIDAGDIVGVEGTVFRTKTEEVTVLAGRLFLLSKSVRPLPEKWHGLKDTDTRYRRRYVDLIVNRDVKASFEKRSRIISAMRRFLDDKGYVEVETPMMQPIFGGALAKPFSTFHNALGIELYLRIAPELYLKRLVVGGLEKVYEINRNFRNEGISVRHNPEFTMLELYTAYWDYNDTASLLEEMISSIAIEVAGSAKITYQGREIDLAPPDGWRRVTILEAIKDELGIELAWEEPAESVREKIGSLLPMSEGELKAMSAVDMIMDLFEEKVESSFIQPTILKDFPKAKSPLAKSKQGDENIAERFELFIGGLEMANAYSELNDPGEQLERFREQLKRREEGDQEAMCVDEDYIRALEYGMPPASGLGVGIDRLVMLLTDSSSIRDVILFPTLRPESGRDREEGDENTPIE